MNRIPPGSPTDPSADPPPRPPKKCYRCSPLGPSTVPLVMSALHDLQKALQTHPLELQDPDWEEEVHPKKKKYMILIISLG